MAQQLALLRTPEAYAAVTAYAHSHTGDAAAAAYLALGHAYLLDKRYTEAEAALTRVRLNDGELGDYADFLAAEAYHEAGDDPAAESILRGFTERYPESIFDLEAPELEANVLLAMNNPEAAAKSAGRCRRTLRRRIGPATSWQWARSTWRWASTQTAEDTFKRLLLGHPLSAEAQTARAKLTQMGVESTLTVTELRSLGDAYYDARDVMPKPPSSFALWRASRPGCSNPRQLCRG